MKRYDATAAIQKYLNDRNIDMMVFTGSTKNGENGIGLIAAEPRKLRLTGSNMFIKIRDTFWFNIDDFKSFEVDRQDLVGMYAQFYSQKVATERWRLVQLIQHCLNSV